MINATPLLILYAKNRIGQLKSIDTAAVQEKQLLSLVKKASITRFGRDHGFESIRSVRDFQDLVPLRSYEALWQEYWERDYPVLKNVTWPGTVPFFAVTSGTTSGTTKYIPYTREMTLSNRKAGLDLLTHHVTSRPKSRILGGKNFMLGGSTDLTEPAPGIYAGDLSGISVKELPIWARPRYFPPPGLALIADWEEKIDVLARETLDTDIRLISGIPSWLLIYFDRLRDLTGLGDDFMKDVFPNLEMLVHGGVNFAPYHRTFLNLLEPTGAELREVYPASEGFIAIADRGYNQGLRMILDHGIFYEFIPVEELEEESPTRHTVADAETGINYALALTTCAGLWGYLIGDTVRFIEKDPPRILITGRTKFMLSAFGEHLILDEVEDAVSTGADHIGSAVTDYAMGALVPGDPATPGRHLLVVEFKGDTPGTEQRKLFAETFDGRLSERNEDYAAHRAGGYGLDMPEVCVVMEGTFAAWQKSRGKLGGQHKVPRIITDDELLQNLQDFTKDRMA